jgi:hypothetical protein
LHTKIAEDHKGHEEAMELLQQKLSALKTSVQQKQEELALQQKQYEDEKARMDAINNQLTEQINNLQTQVRE